MRVRIAPEDLNWMTAKELEIAHQIVDDCKSEMPIEDLAQIAARTASKSNETFQIFKASAWIAGNDRAQNWYYPNSGRLDVWIKCIAFNEYAGCFVIGAYLSDIHSISSITADHIRNHMYIRSYKEQERA